MWFLYKIIIEKKCCKRTCCHCLVSPLISINDNDNTLCDNGDAVSSCLTLIIKAQKNTIPAASRSSEVFMQERWAVYDILVVSDSERYLQNIMHISFLTDAIYKMLWKSWQHFISLAVHGSVEICDTSKCDYSDK